MATLQVKKLANGVYACVEASVPVFIGLFDAEREHADVQEGWYAQALSAIDALRTLYAGNVAGYATASIQAYGTGGNQKVAGWIEGEIPAEIRAYVNAFIDAEAEALCTSHKGMKLDDALGIVKTRPSVKTASAKVNTAMMRIRKVASAAADPAFDLDRNLHTCYYATLPAKKKPGADTATAPDKSAEKPSGAVQITAEQGRAWVESNLLDALQQIEQKMVAMKYTISASQLHSVREALIDEEKRKAKQA